MDLGTTYLGLKLRSPLVAGASPLTEDLDSIKRLEEAGASAIVMHSLFEEQLRQEALELHHHMSHGADSFAEALSYFPEAREYKLGPEEYLNLIQKAKRALKIPVIASLNGSTPGGWSDYARKMQQAGADALELNIYYIPTDVSLSGEKVEQTYLEILKSVKSSVTVPVAVKLSPFFSNMAWTAKQLDNAGANSLVLFNRFYQPDIDLEHLEVKSNVLLSTSHSMRLPLRWIAILHGRLNCDLAATGGVYSGEDAIKMLMAGASVTMLVSALLKHGISHLKTVEQQMKDWMDEHDYESVTQMRGSMSQAKCANPAAFERAQYMKALTGYKVMAG